MRAHANLLGERILQEYPALHQFDDAVSPRIEGLLRTPFPAQTIAIMGVAMFHSIQQISMRKRTWFLKQRLWPPAIPEAGIAESRKSGEIIRI